MKITVKIKAFFFRWIANLFRKYFTYAFDYLSESNDWIIVFNSPIGHPIIIRIPISERRDKTHDYNKGAYLPRSERMDAGWVIKHLTLESKKVVSIFLCAKEDRLMYMQDFKKIQKDRERLQEVGFDMDLVMDLDIKVIGEGNGLKPEERAEVVKIIKNLDLA